MTKITIYEVPPSMNYFAGRKNTWRYREAKQYWTSLVQSSVKWHKKPYKKARVEIVYYFPDSRRRDPDNYSGKFILDGLTKAGLIEDDCFGKITLSLHGRVDKKDPRTEIFIYGDD